MVSGAATAQGRQLLITLKLLRNTHTQTLKTDFHNSCSVYQHAHAHYICMYDIQANIQTFPPYTYYYKYMLLNNVIERI